MIYSLICFHIKINCLSFLLFIFTFVFLGLFKFPTKFFGILEISHLFSSFCLPFGVKRSEIVECLACGRHYTSKDASRHRKT